MMDTDTAHVEEGSNLLARLSNEMVRAQKRYWGKGPVKAKSYMFDDMLFIVMQDGLTTAEVSMLEFGEADLVRQYRQTFENRMTEKLVGMVEEVTRRKVLNYQSQILFDPDRVVEIFVFDDVAPDRPRAATAEGQMSEGEAGAATDHESLADGNDEP
jgi:uncharacterized protein YbcI